MPNDERVIEEIGSRQIILKNVLEAKFKTVAWPILIRSIQESSINKESGFRGFYDHTLFHEISHSIGPQTITKNVESTPVNKALRQHYSVLEEAKADTLAACFMLEKYQAANGQSLLETYVSGFLRAIRFGLKSAHGAANCIQFNFFLRERAIEATNGKIRIHPKRLRQAIFKLASEIIKIEERGDLEAAKSLVEMYCVTSPEIQDLIREIRDLPVDIRIRYMPH